MVRALSCDRWRLLGLLDSVLVEELFLAGIVAVSGVVFVVALGRVVVVAPPLTRFLLGVFVDA